MPCAEGSDRLPCPPDMECRDGYCAGALCRDQTCGACQTCDLSTGLCVDACAGIHCPTGLCHCGRCVAHSCYYMDCPEGSFCRDGRCVTDPCQRTDCGAQGCTMGQCFPLCPAEGCPFHQSCHQGTCVANLCGGEVCPVGQCNPIDGNCSRVCDEVTCLEGMSCDINTGTCTDDRCVGVHCPGGSHCVEGSCYALPPDNVVDAGPVVDSGPQTWVLATGGGGGGGCSSTGTTGQSPVGWVLGFFLVLFFRRKVA
jgi:hypothetical protein